MARTRVKVTLTEPERARMSDLWEKLGDERLRVRLLVIRTAVTGHNTYEEIAEIAGCARSSVGLYLQAFEKGGFAKLLSRGKPKPKATPLAQEDIQKAFKKHISLGTFRTAPQAQAWLEATYGVKRALSTIYYWLKKLRRDSTGPASRPHQKGSAKKPKLPAKV